MCANGMESIACVYIYIFIHMAGADYEAFWRSLVRPNY